ncbi:hypothetical protein FSP39_018842 [Pinctada imbricata]|uniref:Transmembrane protein 117 n=1 Tax=Pinctada imbricata TaxID=66713 RepID=A0AA89C2C1_PINIB|nr:hypothetical protein FSP39_018842 [Pinctada imbricata]
MTSHYYDHVVSYLDSELRRNNSITPLEQGKSDRKSEQGSGETEADSEGTSSKKDDSAIRPPEQGKSGTTTKSEEKSGETEAKSKESSSNKDNLAVPKTAAKTMGDNSSVNSTDMLVQSADHTEDDTKATDELKSGTSDVQSQDKRTDGENNVQDETDYTMKIIEDRQDEKSPDAVADKYLDVVDSPVSVAFVPVTVADVANSDKTTSRSDKPLENDTAKGEGENESTNKNGVNGGQSNNENGKEKPDLIDGDKKMNGNGKNTGKEEIDGIIKLTNEDEDIMTITTDDLERFREKREKLQKGEDEIDAASVWSYVMKKNFRYYFQHPYLRLFIAYFVTFCNFLIYAEDPVAHSRKECTIPMIGNDFAFVCTRYPPNAWSLLKVILWLAGILIGIILGKLLIHTLLFNRLFKLRMFENDMGSWMTMFLTSLVVLFIFSLIYDLFLMIGGDSTTDYRISSLMGLTNSIFMKMAATGTWCGDFFTAWMVTDMMLQERLYPHWAMPVRRWWNRGYNRIILFWLVTSLASIVVIFVIATDYIQWDKLNRDFLHSNEVSRAFLASFILCMDILIVLQDWDFPHFISPIDIKLPGVNTANIKFDIPKCLKREVWQVHITGKWFNYGILFLVMILDLNMWKNQENHNETLLSYDYRSVTINPSTNQTYLSGDTVMNARYNGYHLAIKLIAFIPSVSAFIVFGVLVWKFGRRKPSEKDVYAGRMMKRKKEHQTRFSLKQRFKNFNFRKKVQAVPKLITFTRRDTNTKKGYPENYDPVNDP